MRIVFVILKLLALTVAGQTVEQIRKELAQINTVDAANAFLANHEDINGDVFELNSRVDTTDADHTLFTLEIGQFFETDSEDRQSRVLFRMLDKKTVQSNRIQYIFFDSRKMELRKIESLRNDLLRRIHAGESFDKLASEFSMDGNAKRGGDMGWFEEGMLMAEFEKEVKRNNTGQVFTVDIPSNKWHYIVRKSHQPRTDQKVTLLVVEIKTRH